MIVFYNVKTKKRVPVPEENVVAEKMENLSKKGIMRVRYAFKSKDADGTKLTCFCSKDDYLKFKCKNG